MIWRFGGWSWLCEVVRGENSHWVEEGQGLVDVFGVATLPVRGSGCAHVRVKVCTRMALIFNQEYPSDMFVIVTFV